jgi:hypothetical protein
MSAAELVGEFVRLHPGKLVTPTIVQAWGQTRHQRLSASAIGEAMKKTLRPYGRGVFVAAPKQFPWPQGVLL